MTHRPRSLEAALRGTATDPSADLAAALARAEAEDLVDVAYATTDSPIGPLLVAATPAGPRAARLPDARTTTRSSTSSPSGSAPGCSRHPPGSTRRAASSTSTSRAGATTSSCPLDWQLSRGFRKTVLERLYADVGYGRTVSYLELATMVGNPKASRAVGTAMATNPIPIVVPCHRVLRTGGQLGGYGGGLPAKVKLLELESGGQTLF